MYIDLLFLVLYDVSRAGKKQAITQQTQGSRE